jgi:hypothetical protein
VGGREEYNLCPFCYEPIISVGNNCAWCGNPVNSDCSADFWLVLLVDRIFRKKKRLRVARCRKAPSGVAEGFWIR